MAPSGGDSPLFSTLALVLVLGTRGADATPRPRRLHTLAKAGAEPRSIDLHPPG